MLRKNGGSCRTAELATLLRVSEETVRRNVKKLVNDGAVIKVHGGVFLASSNEEPAFDQRLEDNRGAKRQMAHVVADMVEDGASLFIDNSSTTAYVAKALRARKYLFVVTNSVKAAEKLSAHNHNRVFFAGGELRETDGGAYGASAMGFVRGFTPDFAVISASAVHADKGFMLTDLAEAEMARAYLDNAATSIVVADQTKFGRNGPIVMGDPARVSALVTDATPSAEIVMAAHKWNVEIIVAPQDGEDLVRNIK